MIAEARDTTLSASGVMARIRGSDRGTWTVLVAVLFLVIGFAFPWERVPSTELSELYGEQLRLRFNESVLALPLRMVVMIAALLLLFEVLLGARRHVAGRIVAWSVLALTLAFPYAVNLWEPEIAYDSATVWNSLDEMIWTEMDRSYGYMQTQWREHQPLYHPSSGELTLLERPLAGLFPIPSGAGGGFGPEVTVGRVGSALLDGIDLTLFRTARIPEVFSTILGYSNAFLNLALRGWYFSLMGSLIAIIGLYLPGAHDTLALLRRDLRFVAGSYLLFAGFLLAPRIIADRYVVGWERALARGDKITAERDLWAAARWKPILYYDIDYWSKLGELTRARNCTSCSETLLSLSFDNLRNRKPRESAQYLERFENLYPEKTNYVRYYATAVYRELGVDLYEAGQESAAAEAWRLGLRYAPTSAWYYWQLSLTQFHERRFEDAANSVKHIWQLQQTVFWKRLPGQAQWYVAESWAAFWRGDIAGAHNYYALSLTPENW